MRFGQIPLLDAGITPLDARIQYNGEIWHKRWQRNWSKCENVRIRDAYLTGFRGRIVLRGSGYGDFIGAFIEKRLHPIGAFAGSTSMFAGQGTLTNTETELAMS